MLTAAVSESVKAAVVGLAAVVTTSGWVSAAVVAETLGLTRGPVSQSLKAAADQGLVQRHRSGEGHLYRYRIPNGLEEGTGVSWVPLGVLPGLNPAMTPGLLVAVAAVASFTDRHNVTGCLRVSELAQRMSVSERTTQRRLGELVEHGVVQHAGAISTQGRRYRVTVKCQRRHEYVRNGWRLECRQRRPHQSGRRRQPRDTTIKGRAPVSPLKQDLIYSSSSSTDKCWCAEAHPPTRRRITTPTASGRSTPWREPRTKPPEWDMIVEVLDADDSTGVYRVCDRTQLTTVARAVGWGLAAAGFVEVLFRTQTALRVSRPAALMRELAQCYADRCRIDKPHGPCGDPALWDHRGRRADHALAKRAATRTNQTPTRTIDADIEATGGEQPPGRLTTTPIEPTPRPPQTPPDWNTQLDYLHQARAAMNQYTNVDTQKRTNEVTPKQRRSIPGAAAARAAVARSGLRARHSRCPDLDTGPPGTLDKPGEVSR